MGWLSRALYKLIVLSNEKSIKSAEDFDEKIMEIPRLINRLDAIESELIKCRDLKKEIDLLYQEVKRIEKEKSENVNYKIDDDYLYGKIYELIKKSGLRDYSSDITELKRKITVTNDEKNNTAVLLKIERENDELKQQNKILNQNNKYLLKEIEDLKKRIDVAEDKLRNVTTSESVVKVQNDKVKIPVDNTAPEPVSVPVPAKYERTYIDQFILSKSEKLILLDNTKNEAKINRYLSLFRNLSEIEAFLLENEKYENFRIYLKNIRKCLENIDKVINKIHESLEKISESEISEKLTNSLFKVVFDGLIDKIIPSASKRIEKNNDSKYIKLVELINNYLNSVGVYTYNDIFVNEVLSDKKSEYFNITPVPTSDKKLYGIVSKISVLPYAVNFYNSDGEPDMTYHEGNVSVYSEG